MSIKPSGITMLYFLRDHYGMSFEEIRNILHVPTHPHDLRDQFAGQAMQSFILNPTTLNHHNWASIVSGAYQIADAMLKERSKEKPNASSPPK